MRISQYQPYSTTCPHISAPQFEACVYPWQALDGLRDYILHLIAEGLDGFVLAGEGVYVHSSVEISDKATLIGPVILGRGCTVRPGAYIRGSLLAGEDCVIGNSSEVKNTILLSRVQLPHYNYVGDSVLGNGAHMGAGAVCSNLKADKSNVTVHAQREIPTSLRKLGATLGDGADIGCGCVLNPGTVIGRNTCVYPLTSVRGVIPSGCIVKAMGNIVERA